MSVRHSAEEYPEHLNPFHTRKNSFKESIRGLRNTLVRSFRGHDKNRPEIRKRQDTTVVTGSVQPSRHTLSVIPRTQPYETPVLLPRSRFSERVPKEKPSPPQADQTKEQNPFDKNDLPPAETQAKVEINQPEVITPTPTERKRFKRKKKRAPIPPNANGDVAHSSMNGSKWSLVSTDTEYSSACPSDYEPDYVHHEIEPGKAEEIFQITEEIKKLTDRTDSSLNLNNDVNEVPRETKSPVDNEETSSEIVENREAPQNTPPNGLADTKETSSGVTEDRDNIDTQINSTEIDDKKTTDDTNETSSGVTEDKDNIDTQINSTEIDDKKTTDDTNETSSGVTQDKEDNAKIISADTQINSTEIEDNKSTDDTNDYQIRLRDDLAAKADDDDVANSTKTNEKVIIDDHNNNTEVNVLHRSQCDMQMIDDDEETPAFHFSESIVMAYTKDETNEERFLYREKRSISLSGSTDELQKADDHMVARRIEQFEESSSSPTKEHSPKGRKSVPSKENMLG